MTYKNQAKTYNGSGWVSINPQDNTTTNIPADSMFISDDSGSGYLHDIDGNTIYSYAESNIIRNASVTDSYIAYSTGNDVKVYDSANNSFLYNLTQASNTVYGVDIYGDSIIYASGDNNGYVHDLTNGNLLHTFSEGSTQKGAAISGSYYAIGGNDAEVNIYDSSGSFLKSFSGGGGGYHVQDCDLYNGYAFHTRNDNFYCNDISSGNQEFSVAHNGSNNMQTCDVVDGMAIYSNVNEPHTVTVPEGNIQQELTESDGRTGRAGISKNYTAYTSGTNVYIHNISDWSLYGSITQYSNSLHEVAFKQ